MKKPWRRIESFSRCRSRAVVWRPPSACELLCAEAAPPPMPPMIGAAKNPMPPAIASVSELELPDDHSLRLADTESS